MEATRPVTDSQVTASQMEATAYDIDRPAPPSDAKAAHDPLIGRRIDHFEIRALLGEGGMGTVYLAHDLSLERPVALKILRRDLAEQEHLVARLVLEARAQARLQHPNVVTIYYIGSYEGAPYFAMEFVRGQTLADQLAETGPLPWPQALEYIIQTTRALTAALARGIVHRDIKPSNLICNGSPIAGAPVPDVKVADFGLAAPLGATEGQFVGSPFYAAPEQISGESPNHRSDIYALGVTFHELLTGSPPFQAGSLKEMLTLHRTAPRPEIPAESAPWRLRQLITEMMDPDPQRRPWTYEELLARLESLRPNPRIAGGVVARGMALAVDLTLLAIGGQIIASLFSTSQRLANQIGLLLFAVYYVVAHKMWGKTIGKRLLGLRIQGTTRAVTALGLVLRFFVEFWGPVTAVVMLNLQLGAATDLETVKTQITAAVGMREIPILDASTEALLQTVLVPNLLVAIPWLAGFLFAFFDDTRQTLHDRAAHTRVIYEIRPT